MAKCCIVVMTVLSDNWGLIAKYNKISAKYFIIFDYETFIAKETSNRLGYSKKISRVFA